MTRLSGIELICRSVVHAKASGAWGEFEVTNDISKYTCAKFLNGVGKKTPVLWRLSTTAGERGAADTVRDVRGFAVKFFTEEGNHDIVGNHIVRLACFLAVVHTNSDCYSLFSSSVTRSDSHLSTEATSETLLPIVQIGPW